MLGIGKMDSGGPSERYYLEQVARGREDYYAAGESPGEWLGSGAERLGLEGEVDPEAFRALLAGRDPVTDQELRRPPREGAVSGFDLCFRAPKSVSVLYGAAEPELAEAVAEAHTDAVDDALSYLERAACRARRGHAGAEQVEGRGFVAAAFRHSTSRAGDPQLHTHAVCANLTEGPDGRHTALDGRALYAHAKTAGYLYQAALRAHLTSSVGVDWTPPHKGSAEIAGVPRRVIEHFSQRRAEIEERLTELGLSSARAAQAAALDTRRHKDYDVDLDRLRSEWRSRAAEHGLGPRELRGLLDRTEHRGLTRAELGAVVERLAGAEGLTERQSSFDRRDAIQAWAEAARLGASSEPIERIADRFLATPQVVALEGSAPLAVRRHDGRLVAGQRERRYSTPGLLRTERELVAGSLERRGQGIAVAEAEALERALRERPTLSSEQRGLVRTLAGSGDGVAVVRSPAGAGKTFCLDAARAAWAGSGHEVYGCALSARAAAELSEQAGLPATTIARLERDLEAGFSLDRDSVLVVDEAGMVGTRALARLAEQARSAEAKLVLVGDDRQLPEIEAGGAFHALAERLGALELSDNRRQVEAWERQALAEIRRGELARGLSDYAEHSRLRVLEGAEETRTALISDWWRGAREVGKGQALMLAGRRLDVYDLNRRARALLRAEGRLGPEELEVAGRSFAQGERVLCTKNHHGLGVRNGTRGTVEQIDREAGTLSLATDRGERTELPADYLASGHLDWGYAMTAHKAQGATVERCYVLGGEETYREWAYTALSRHRQEARFYLNGAELELEGREREKPAEEIARQIGESRAKELALDHLEAEWTRELPTPELERLVEERRDLLSTYPAEAARAAEEAERRAERWQQERQGARNKAAYERRGLEAVSFWERSERQRFRFFMKEAEHHAERAGAEAGRERAEAERHDQAPARWLREHSGSVRELCALEGELREREQRARAAHLRSVCADPAEDLVAALGPRPEGLAGREEWERAAMAVEGYRLSYGREEDVRELLKAEPRSWEAREQWSAWYDTRSEVKAFSREAGRELEALERPGRGRGRERDSGLEIDLGW